jgi:predicted metal-binding membrane protein
MQAMSGARISTMGGFVPFVSGWAAMMVAMMIPATLPLILLYHIVARRWKCGSRRRLLMPTSRGGLGKS